MRRKSVLLVEDHEDSRIICATILQHHGYAVLEAADVQSGLVLARTHRPDLILMDVTLPGALDGWMVVERLKRDGATQGIPVVALTAQPQGSDGQRARLLGCAAYLVKPYTPSYILKEVRRIIGPATDAVAG